MRGGPARLAGGVALVLAAGVVTGGCNTSKPKQAGPPPTVAGGTPTTVGSVPTIAVQAQPGERRPEAASFLVRAGGCERFAEAVRAVAVESVGPYGFTGPQSYAAGGTLAPTTTMLASGAAPAARGAERAAAAPTAGVDFSGTNVQEAGVDEPDTVKTDGRVLVSAVDGRLRVVDVTSEPRLVGTLDLPQAAGRLLLVGDRALVLSSGSAGPIPEFVPGAPAPRPTTIVTVVDLKDPTKPSVARTHTIDGSYVDARLVGGVARIVTRSSPDISFPRPSSGRVAPDQRATAANADVVRKAAPTAFLPKGASCEDAYVPVAGAGVGTVAVQSVDPGAESPGPAVTVVASASTVYASATRLFVATNRHRGDGQGRTGGAVPVEPSRTAIHAFDITDPAKARYAGSGDVPGQLLNQFSLSEHEGVLRVATTIDGTAGSGRDPGIPVPMPVPRPGPTVQPTAPGQAPSGNGQPPPVTSPVTTVVTSPATATVAIPAQSESRVSILRPAGEEWVEVGAVGGLGRGERIYAVRFLGATGYVVTFRQVDPLYVLDLRDVRAPKVTGELKITGYSAYLHPAGEGRLLGIGQEATDQGRRLGTQLSLFDVRDPASPTKLAGAVVAQGSSAAESDHHAFLFWPATGLVVAPVRSYGGDIQGPGSSGQPFVGAVAFKVGDRSVAEAGRITHPGSTPIERTVVVRDRLLTVSRIGVAANDLGSLADRGYLTFR